MVHIPVIETPRLRLRAHHVDDFADYVALWADPEVVRYIGGVPSTREQTWARLLRAAGLWHHLGFGFLAIEEKESGAFIGEAGFHEVRRNMTPSIEGSLETGWLLSPASHGKGYANEALTALIEWAGLHFPQMDMTAIIHPDNAPSLKLASKLGFVETARTNYHGEVIIFSRENAAKASTTHAT
ncbi:GNAT family N-acetyltransferase [Agrobacterium larrymoorei]|uniref:GNAT family N-acetyltransferase n=1 Tax=Agrobacterium larrymoorei TaxID=160699 RepID=A0AAF0KFS5_9HYPH|nr:GNAT family N-acetyltransferase [Agrobacterium larrymoorei]WHA43406.1 GNAT family N-acetyltransferase [Agrobacterium larrymoorei]